MNEPRSVLEDYILARIAKFTLLMLVQGEPQMGKSLFTWYLLNNLSIYKFKEPWDYKKYCARNLVEFARMLKQYDNKLIVWEESAKDISIDELYSKFNHFFNILMQTQGYKHNLIAIVFPASMQVSKRQRYFIKLGVEIIDKIDEEGCHATKYKPTIYKRDFSKLDEDDLHRKWWKGRHWVKYSDEDLAQGREYTKWLEDMKAKVMDETLDQIELEEEVQLMKKEKIRQKIARMKKITELKEVTSTT